MYVSVRVCSHIRLKFSFSLPFENGLNVFPVLVLTHAVKNILKRSKVPLTKSTFALRVNRPSVTICVPFV